MNIDDVISLANAGLRIMPLLSKNKVPILKDWQLKATTDEVKIRQWFAIHKGCNWGVATGMDSGIFVVDIDPKAGGDKTWKRLVKKNGIPDTVTVHTGGGGIHYYFHYPKRSVIRNSASKIGPGVDVRGDGGQVVAAGSTHPSGTMYEWAKGRALGEVTIAKPPKWLMEMIEQTAPDDDQTQMGDPLEKGTRNNQIYHQALYLARQGALQEFAVAAMLTWCETTGEKDIPKDEVEATVASAYKKAKEEAKGRGLVDEVELSDVGNAQRLVKLSGDNIRYVPSIGWHVWSGKHWQRDAENLTVSKLAIDAIDQFKQDTAEQLKITTDRAKAQALVRVYNWMVSSHSAAKLSAMIEVSKVYPEVVRRPADMDNEETTFLLNCTNGILDLRTGELVPHDREKFITRLLPYDYNPKAKCPTWTQTLNLAFNHDKELIDYFQRAIGYTLSAALSEQCFFICWGESGNNGKSTMLEAIQRILGEDYALMTDARVISSKDKDNHVFSSLAALHMVRMVSINEISEMAYLDEELIKQLTGGDTVQAKRLYMEPFTYKPTFKIWMRANNKPIIHTTGEAFWRRVKLIPFTQPIPKEKRRPRHEIDMALAEEAEGILAWMVRGFQDWYTNGGLRDPAAVKAASAEYREASDVVAQFMSECTEPSPKSTMLRKNLYNAFKAWHDEQGLRYIMNATKFSTKVANLLNQHTRVTANGQAIWKGIKLTDQAQLTYMVR